MKSIAKPLSSLPPQTSLGLFEEALKEPLSSSPSRGRRLLEAPVCWAGVGRRGGGTAQLPAARARAWATVILGSAGHSGSRFPPRRASRAQGFPEAVTAGKRDSGRRRGPRSRTSRAQQGPRETAFK